MPALAIRHYKTNTEYYFNARFDWLDQLALGHRGIETIGNATITKAN